MRIKRHALSARALDWRDGMKAMMKLILVAMAATVIFPGCAERVADDFYGMHLPGGVSGTLTVEDGAPLPGGVVYFYSDIDRNFRGPADYMAEPADDAGLYLTELPPGSYWVVARKRLSGDISGNLQKGDYLSREAHGPIIVREGEYTNLDISLHKLEGNMLLNAFVGRSALQGIRGRITDRRGQPVERAYAFAYKDARMAGKPDYVSGWTRDDGKFDLYVEEPGVYYVGARTGYMGVPRPDEPYGRLENKEGSSVKVDAGEFEDGVVIILKRFSDYR